MARYYRGAGCTPEIFEPEPDKFLGDLEICKWNTFAGKFSIEFLRNAPAFAIQFEFGKEDATASCHIEKSLARGRTRVGKVAALIHVGKSVSVLELSIITIPERIRAVVVRKFAAEKSHANVLSSHCGICSMSPSIGPDEDRRTMSPSWISFLHILTASSAFVTGLTDTPALESLSAISVCELCSCVSAPCSAGLYRTTSPAPSNASSNQCSIFLLRQLNV